MIQRRAFLTGLASALAAPAIVRAGSLMPVRALDPSLTRPIILPIYSLESKWVALKMYRVSWSEHWDALATEIIHPSDYFRA